MISSDNIQGNIQQLNNKFFTIKAKRRRLYFKEWSTSIDQNLGLVRVDTSSSSAADRDDPLAASTADSDDQPALTTPLGGHAALSPERSYRTPPSSHSPSSTHKGIHIQGRTSLHWISKSKAIIAINTLTSATPINAYRIASIVDCPNVEVSIAESTLTDAGLGLFFTMGPSADGSAPPGTLLATYSGVTLTSSADRARVTSWAYVPLFIVGFPIIYNCISYYLLLHLSLLITAFLPITYCCIFLYLSLHYIYFLLLHFKIIYCCISHYLCCISHFLLLHF